MMKVIIFVWSLLLVIFSYGFVEHSFPLPTPDFLFQLIHTHRGLTTLIYIILVFGLFGIYFYLLRRAKQKRITVRQTWSFVILVSLVLFFSWPAFSHDIFNYMATAKVTFFYQENPYLVMPMEFTGEPMLAFMHAANKFALYGPAWILLTAIPHFLGWGNLILTVFTFKLLILGFYLALCWLIWKMSHRDHYALIFFAFNPLVLIETLVSAHNDVVMMYLVLLAIWLEERRQRFWGWIVWLASVGIKFATIALLPLIIFLRRFKRQKWFVWSAVAMLLVFLAAPLREEIYSWYWIWVVSFVALIPQKRFFRWLAWAFSFSLLLRYTPFLYWRNYGGLTPMVKALTTFVPPTLMLIFFGWQKIRPWHHA